MRSRGLGTPYELGVVLVAPIQVGALVYQSVDSLKLLQELLINLLLVEVCAEVLAVVRGRSLRGLHLLIFKLKN